MDIRSLLCLKPQVRRLETHSCAIMPEPAGLCICEFSDSDNDDIAKLHNNSALDIAKLPDTDAEFCDVGEKHDIIESHFDGVGWLGPYSFDKSTRTVPMKLVTLHRPTITVLSPPCTVFSPLMTMWNRKKMHKNKFDVCKYCMEVATKQITEGRHFILEQPYRVGSCGLNEVWAMAPTPTHTACTSTVMTAEFDMKAKYHGCLVM